FFGYAGGRRCHVSDLVACLGQHRLFHPAGDYPADPSAGIAWEGGRKEAMRIFKTIGLLVLLAFAIAFPLLFPNPAVTGIAVFTLIFAAAATGWNIFSGYTGYIALGHAAYFGLGAYALAIMCQVWHIPGGYTPFFLVPVAGWIAALFAVPLGWVALRVRRHTFVVKIGRAHV